MHGFNTAGAEVAEALLLVALVASFFFFSVFRFNSSAQPTPKQRNDDSKTNSASFTSSKSNTSKSFNAKVMAQGQWLAQDVKDGE